MQNQLHEKKETTNIIKNDAQDNCGVIYIYIFTSCQ